MVREEGVVFVDEEYERSYLTYAAKLTKGLNDALPCWMMKQSITHIIIRAFIRTAATIIE